jgi:hypothetical protein
LYLFSNWINESFISDLASEQKREVSLVSLFIPYGIEFQSTLPVSTERDLFSGKIKGKVFNPTCVENRPRLVHLLRLKSVQPHVCGE